MQLCLVWFEGLVGKNCPSETYIIFQLRACTTINLHSSPYIYSFCLSLLNRNLCDECLIRHWQQWVNYINPLIDQNIKSCNLIGLLKVCFDLHNMFLIPNGKNICVVTHFRAVPVAEQNRFAKQPFPSMARIWDNLRCLNWYFAFYPRRFVLDYYSSSQRSHWWTCPRWPLTTYA